ncbi:MAG: uroporphyrinogen decarboxylase [Planctomycetes bacterium]|nr:uroporphyrinogen decarboxylase [Planctomycetota bacterium]
MSDPLIVRALRGEPVERTPIWMMRQAGRYLPEYREVRSRHSFLEVCKRPELAAEVTLQPLRRFAFDAAILFSDILIPVEAMGAPVEFGDGGPHFRSPIRSREQVNALRVPEPAESMPFVAEAVRTLVRELPAGIPLLGFAGAPFTLLTYLVEGGGSKDFAETKRFLTHEPEAATTLLDKLARTVAKSLEAQIRAGCCAVQLFDTWASVLSPADYERYALPYARAVFTHLAALRVPRLYYVNGIAGILERAAETGADALSVDWRIGLADVRARAPRLAVQGNLDPHWLLAPEPVLRERVRDVLHSNGGRLGHVFNLGHGIFPSAPVEAVQWMVDEVRRFEPRR